MDNELLSAKLEPLLRQACAQLNARIRQGEDCRCEQLLESHPDLADSVEATLELIYAEFVVREEIGQEPDPEELCVRFPVLRGRIERLVSIHRVLASERAASSNAISGVETHASPSMGLFGRNVAEERERVGQYELIDEVARGGMGVVYRARQTGLDRIVALKMIRWRFPGLDELQRFRSEAESAARLQHPHIVQIFEIGEDQGDAFIAMEYVEGGSLADRLDGDPMKPEAAAALLELLARATHYAHERDVIHRDLKPSNVLLTTAGEPKVTDFGLAKQLTKDSSLTRPGAMLGTPSYMSPEQALGELEVGPASDVYGLGATMYEMLTGRPPFIGTSEAETLDQVRNQSPLAPRQLQPTLPKDLETICLKALRKEPPKRYASAQAMADDVQRFLAGQPIYARPVRATERAIKWIRREPPLAFAICLLAAITIAAFVIVNAQRMRAEKGWNKAAEEATLKDNALTEQRIQTLRAEHRQYVLLMASAQRQWSLGNVLKTRQLLSECPQQFRGWEWHVLQRLSQQGQSLDLASFPYSFATNGNQIAAGMMNGQLLLVDAVTRTITKTIEPPDIPQPFVTALAFSLDGKTVAWSCSSQGMILPGPRVKKDDKRALAVLRILDTGSGKIRSIGLPSVYGLACHPEGEFVVTAGFEGEVVLHHLSSDRPSEVLREGTGRSAMTNCDISHDGKLLAISQSHDVSLLDLATRKETAKLTLSERVLGVRFSPLGGSFAAATGQKTEIWSIRYKRRVRTFQAKSRQPLTLAYSPDGKLLVTAGANNELQFWNVAGREFDTLRGHPSKVSGAGFVDGGKQIVSAASLAADPKVSSAGQLKFWDSEKTLAKIVRKPREYFVRSTDGLRAVRFDHLGLHVIDTVARQETALFKIPKAEQRVLNHDGSFEVLRNGRTIQVYDLGTGDRISSCALPDGVTIPVRKKGTRINIFAGRPIRFVKALSLDGQRFLVVEAGGLLKQLSSQTGQVDHEFEGRMMTGREPIFSDDGKFVAGAVMPGKLAIWSAENGKLLHHLEMRGGPYVIRFGPAGRRIAAAGPRQSVWVWDLTSGQLLREMSAHRTGIQGLAFTPDGTRLASSATEIKLWDLATGNELVNLGNLTGIGAHRLGFSLDGKFLISVSQDGLVKHWNGAKTD